MQYKLWLNEYIEKQFGVVIDQELENEPILGSAFHMTVPEIAYLLVEVCKQFEVPIEWVIDRMDERITINGLSQLLASC